jgi:hypothetical protein
MKNKIFLITSVSAALILGTGCTKNFESINTDPNSVSASVAPFSSLLTNAELITSGNSDGNAYEDWRGNLIYASCMIQHLSSTTGYWDGDKYTFSASYLSSMWDQNYGPQGSGGNQNNNSSPIQNIVEVVAHSKGDTSKVNLYNIARIFKVFMFQRMTDMYGDCPYSQAGLGYISGITSPKYDKQQDIYTDMLNELQDAASKLNPAAANPGPADLIYGGDPAKWKKFAFSEMVRIAMRMSKVDPTNAQKWAQTAFAGGVFADNTDNAILQHQNAAPNGAGSQVANGSGAVLGLIDPTSGRLSATFVNTLKATNDPRLPYFGTVVADPTVATDMGDTTGSNQLGQPNGFDLSGGPFDISTAPGYPGTVNKYSVVNRFTYARTTAPTFFVTYAETEFLLAEAAQNGWISASAATLYSNGVSAAMQQLGLQGGAGPGGVSIAAYVAAHPLTAGSELKQINTQYWIASFMDETEAWANWRRSNFPTLTPVSNYPGNATNGTIPRRYTYPQGEAATNTVNYNAAVAGLANGDKMTSRMWWDK